MRVLLISHTCQSRTEGQPKAVCLSRVGDIELCVLAPDRWKHYGQWRKADPPQVCDFRYLAGKVRWPWAGPAQFYLHFYPGLARLLRDFQPDIIDLWEEPWSLVSAQAVLLRNRLLPSARILSETEQNINKRLPFPFEAMRRFTLRHADFAVGRNAEAIRVLREKGYAGPAAVVPNAVDTALFRPLDRAECRRALGVTGFTAGYVGRLVEEKGLLDMVEALEGCPDDVRLLFVGSGPLLSRLEERGERLGKARQIRFLPAQPLESLPRIMNALDVLVLPSRTTPRWKEQFGRVIIEAHACRTPVIGSDSGAIPEVVGEGGWIVPEGDAAALGRALRCLRADPERRALLGRRGREQVEARFTWERVAEQMAALYRRIGGD